MPDNFINTKSSILTSIKKMLGGVVDNGDQTFDMDLIIHINSVLSSLNQMGIGVQNFEVTGHTQTWQEFLNIDSTVTTEEQQFQMVKSYVYFKVRLMFDPPSSSVILQTINENVKELEFRLYSKANFKNN